MAHATSPVHFREPPGCCTGWYFEHTAECHTPTSARPCSDCGADPSAGHNLHTCSWYWSDDDVSAYSGMSLDAARWPGYALDDQPDPFTPLLAPPAIASIDRKVTPMSENDNTEPKSILRKIREHLTHDIAKSLTHVSGLIGLHVVALAVIEHAPALPMLGLH
ncbi:hypothetical protein [Actinoplanes sp. HUAS TT8]|uniref:hypothetical protein n=1 Tax=Actinoplanes sp. HUAS TT8 TaxID=3447453 RepID=UPI003F5232E3